MTVRPKFLLECMPQLRVHDPMRGKVSTEPVEERETGDLRLPCSVRQGAGGVGMLPIATATPARGEDRCGEADFGNEGLVLIQAPETLFEASDLLDDFPSHQQAACAW